MSCFAPRNNWGVATTARYRTTQQIGEGTYGVVFRAEDIITREVVALKRMVRHHESEGFPRTETREIKILNSLRHPHLVHLKELVTDMSVEKFNAGEVALRAAAAAAASASSEGAVAESPDASEISPLARLGDIFLVFEYVDYDLAGLLDSGYKFDVKQVKLLMFQLLSVLDFLHARGIVHRDLKCSNLLLKDDTTLKLADFGLARSLAPEGDGMTNRVITLWYRPPELLLGATAYGPAVDLWSVGCILLELLIGRPCFPAKVEAEQIESIMRVLGTPPEDSALRALPLWGAHASANPELRRSRLAEWVGKHEAVSRDADCVALIMRLLEGDPRKRITARDALTSRYFKDIPRDNPSALLKGSRLISSAPGFRAGVDHHEFSAKARRKAAAEGAAAEGAAGGPHSAVKAPPSAQRAGAGAGAGYGRPGGPGGTYPADLALVQQCALARTELTPHVSTMSAALNARRHLDADAPPLSTLDRYVHEARRMIEALAGIMAALSAQGGPDAARVVEAELGPLLAELRQVHQGLEKRVRTAAAAGHVPPKRQTGSGPY